MGGWCVARCHGYLESRGTRGLPPAGVMNSAGNTQQHFSRSFLLPHDEARQRVHDRLEQMVLRLLVGM